ELSARRAVGDGLVSQIPGLMVSTAAGILVTKNASESGLGTEVGGQLLARPAAMRTVAGVLCGIGLLPGMPTFAFFLLAGTVFLGAGRLQAKKAADAATPATPAENAEAPVEELLGVDRLSIEIGYRLIGLVDPGRHGGLLDHIRAL